LYVKSVSGSEKSRLDRDRNQQRCIANDPMMVAFSLNTCSRVRHWSTALSITLCGTDDVMATRNLRHCEILQGKVSSQEVQW